MSEKDGGPAFPVEFAQLPDKELATGLSMRDYFAAAALQGLTACQHTSGTSNDFSEKAYEYADAMLKEREK